METLIVKNISKSFETAVKTGSENLLFSDGKIKALDDISFSLSNGICIIAGANGAGKSLLMSIIAGLESPDSGSVFTAGKAGLIFQDPESQILGETPREDISFAPKNLKLSKEEINFRVLSALKETGLLDKADYPARFLSGGEKKRLSIAGILAMDAEIIVFDEPYANLDYPSIIQINQIISNLNNKSKTIIILTHEIEKCLAFSNRFIVLHKGKLVFDASPKEALLQDLKVWGIHNPIGAYEKIEDMIWI
ncbi:MAG: energy-coupling factor ABC transporter ATP-binding protein [Elusimicrobiota bacterium]|jgi:biotin transport system ATP-binding protein|nr:energy-coupling factor ABC transporter ATP-binding protein [Elusimicrobiota bacterium]